MLSAAMFADLPSAPREIFLCDLHWFVAVIGAEAGVKRNMLQADETWLLTYFEALRS
jgi:hypothetical protein